MLDIGPPKPLFQRPDWGAVAQGSATELRGTGGFSCEEGGSNLSVTVILNWFEQLKGGPETAR